MLAENYINALASGAKIAPRNLVDVASLISLGAPVVADVDLIVVSVNMKVGAYTVAAQPDVPRIITCTRTVVGGTDTPGTLVIVGTNANGKAITETLTVGAHATLVEGTKAFKTVTSVTGVGWVTNTTEDTITVGVGKLLGLPFTINAAADVLLGILGTTVTAHNPTVGSPATIEESLIDMSAGTYDGSKKAMVFVQNVVGGASV